MPQQSNPPELPTVFRGGRSLLAKDYEVKLDRVTGLLKTSHGVSVDSDAAEVARFGGAYLVATLPEGLRLLQRGRRKSHYEIVPSNPMPFSEYQRLLDDVELKPFDKDGLS